MNDESISVIILQLDNGWEVHSRSRRATKTFTVYQSAFSEALAWAQEDGGNVFVQSSAGKYVYDCTGRPMGHQTVQF